MKYTSPLNQNFLIEGNVALYSQIWTMMLSSKVQRFSKDHCSEEVTKQSHINESLH